MKRYLTAAILLLSLTRLEAQQYSASFLEINPDPYLNGMGNAGTAMHATAFSFWNNTASTVFSERTMDIGLSYGMWQPGMSRDQNVAVAGYGKLNSFMTLSAGFRYISHSPYDITDPDGMFQGSYTPKDMTAGIGLAFRFAKIISLSANISYLRSDMGDEYRSNGITADFGAMVNLKFMRIGLTASNIGTRIDYGGASSYALPADLRLGLSTTRKVGPDKESRHEISASLQGGMLLAENSFFGEAGIEYVYNSMIRIAAGYHYGNDRLHIPQYASVGLGVRLWGISLNASYLIGTTSSSPMTNTFSIGLGYSF